MVRLGSKNQGEAYDAADKDLSSSSSSSFSLSSSSSFPAGGGGATRDNTTTLALAAVRSIPAHVIRHRFSLPSLRRVNLSRSPMLRDRDILCLAALSPKLEVALFTECSGLTGTSLLAMAANCPRLTTLRLSNVTRVGDAAVTALAKACPLLSRLTLAFAQERKDEYGLSRDFSEFSDVGLGALFCCCGGLKELDVRFNTRITGAGVFRQLQLQAQQQQQQRKLHFSPRLALTSFVLRGCSRVATETLSEILSACPLLTRLDVSACGSMVNGGGRGVQFEWLLTLLGLEGCMVTTNQEEEKGEDKEGEAEKEEKHKEEEEKEEEKEEETEEEAKEKTKASATRERRKTKKKEEEEKEEEEEEIVADVSHPIIRTVASFSRCLSKTAWGFSPTPDHHRLRVLFARRYRLERAAAMMIQQRYRTYRTGDFTLLYLLVWTRRLKRKADVDRCALCCQSLRRGNVGRRIANRRRRKVNATLIQKNVRAWLARREIRRLRVQLASCIRLQRAYRRALWRGLELGVRAEIERERQRERDRRESEHRAMLTSNALVIQNMYRIWKAGALMRFARRVRKQQVSRPEEEEVYTRPFSFFFSSIRSILSSVHSFTDIFTGHPPPEEGVSEC